jgi:hypothetical protein
MSPRKRREKRELVQEVWPQNLSREDFDMVRSEYMIFTYQKVALRQQVKATRKTEAELVRDALDHLLFKKRREDDIKAREVKSKKKK